MTKKKAVAEIAYTQYLNQYGKNHRYCVRFSANGRTICIDYYKTLQEALAAAIFTSFDELWTDSPLIFKDYPLEKEAERVEIMEWSEPTRRDALILLDAKTEQKRIKIIENLFRKYGNTLALKASFILKERRMKKKGAFIKGLFLSDTLGLCVGANNQPEKKKKKTVSKCQKPAQVNFIGSMPPFSPVPEQPPSH